MRKTAASVTIALTVLGGGVSGGRHALATATHSPTSGAPVVQTALKYLGAPYTARGTSPETGFNDLAFVRYAYAQSGITLHIGIASPAYKRLLTRGERVRMADLQPGDVMFFRNTIWRGFSHVGIYVGDGKFVHAEWYGYGVRISSLRDDRRDGNYWAMHYATANRPWLTP